MPLKPIRELRFITENCESWTVPANKIVSLRFDDIRRDASLANTNDWHEHESCMSFFLCMTVLDMESIPLPEWGWPANYGMTFRKRLAFRDLTHIDVIFEDGTNVYLGVPWKSDPTYMRNEWHPKKENVYYHTGMKEDIYCLSIQDPDFVSGYSRKKKKVTHFTKYRRMRTR